MRDLSRRCQVVALLALSQLRHSSTLFLRVLDRCPGHLSIGELLASVICFMLLASRIAFGAAAWPAAAPLPHRPAPQARCAVAQRRSRSPYTRRRPPSANQPPLSFPSPVLFRPSSVLPRPVPGYGRAGGHQRPHAGRIRGVQQLVSFQGVWVLLLAVDQFNSCCRQALGPLGAL